MNWPLQKYTLCLLEVPCKCISSQLLGYELTTKPATIKIINKKTSKQLISPVQSLYTLGQKMDQV